MSEPALSSSLNMMYPVRVPPIRKKESTEGRAFRTASKATPQPPLKQACGAMDDGTYLSMSKKNILFVTAPIEKGIIKLCPRTTQVMLINLERMMQPRTSCMPCAS